MLHHGQSFALQFHETWLFLLGMQTEVLLFNTGIDVILTGFMVHFEHFFL
jgi:hypothetical protein